MMILNKMTPGRRKREMELSVLTFSSLAAFIVEVSRFCSSPRHFGLFIEQHVVIKLHDMAKLFRTRRAADFKVVFFQKNKSSSIFVAALDVSLY